MKNITTLLLIINIFITLATEAKMINGIDIPDCFNSIIEEYRCEMARSAMASVGKQDFGIHDLDELVKAKVKYDAIYYCPICNVNYPISSKYLNLLPQKYDDSCLDGFPEKSDFLLPPECPYCGWIFPFGEFELEKIQIAKIDVWYPDYVKELHKTNPCERYVRILDFFQSLNDYDKALIYLKYARSSNCREINVNLEKAVEHIEIYLNSRAENENFIDDNFIILFLRIDLLRQLEKFDKAKICVNHLKQQFRDGNSYYKILLDKEIESIDGHLSKPIKKPFGNQLHIAIHDKKSIDNLILGNGELINQLNIKFQSPLIQAVCEGNLNAVKSLLNFNKELINDKDIYNNSILHIATRYEKIDMIETLIKFGCDINSINDRMQTPLCSAIKFGNYEAMDLLLKHGANYNATDFQSNTPLLLTCIYKNKQSLNMFKRLLLLSMPNSKYDSAKIIKCYELANLHNNTEICNYIKEQFPNI